MKYCVIIIALIPLLGGVSHPGHGREAHEHAVGGFVASQRAGVDRLAGNPTWETMRLQDLTVAVQDAGLCPKGIAKIERKAEAVRQIEIGTSRDLVYTGTCK